VCGWIEDAEVEIPDGMRSVLHQMCLEVRELEGRIAGIEKQLKALWRQSAPMQQLQSIPGVGLLTATAVSGFVGDLQRFDSGRHFASYLGLTPREHSSGLRRRLGRISKQGDVYLRTLWIHGGRSYGRPSQSSDLTVGTPGVWKLNNDGGTTKRPLQWPIS
jgi:transposase